MDENIRWAMAAFGVCLGAIGLLVAALNPGHPRWRHASEQRPPDGTDCWVYLKGGDVSLATAMKHAAGGWHNQDTWEDFRGDVCFWMPATVPNPPTEEEWRRWRS